MKVVSILLLITSLFSVTPATQQSGPADLVFINGNIYTANDKQPRAEALAVRGDRIVFVGSNAAAKRYQGPRTRVIDLRGATVLPGFTDAHCHLIGIGQREMTLNLEGITSLEDFLAKVKARVDQAKPGEWITGRGWIETFWKPPVFPTRQDLDKIAPSNPVFLNRADGHGGVANSSALKIGGITKETKDPFGGQILRDKESGEAVGMLLDTAQGLVAQHIPARTEGDVEQAVILGVKRSIELGWTQVQDAGGSFRTSTFSRNFMVKERSKYGFTKRSTVRARHLKGFYARGPSLAPLAIALTSALSRSFQMALSVQEAQPCSRLTATRPTVKDFCE